MKKDKQHDEEVSFEATDESGESALSLKVSKLKEELLKIKREREEYLLGWQRTRADYANQTKEFELQKKELFSLATKKLIGNILPVLDHYQMAKTNKEAWEAVDTNWRNGIEYIFKELEGVLEKEGLVTIGVVGEKFDPKKHESLEVVEVSDTMLDNSVVEVIQNGYELAGRMIRAAKVKVGHLKQ